MGQKLIHKHSNVQGKLPSGNTLEHGEIAVNYNSTEPFISIRKDDNEYARFIDESAVDAKIKNANDTIQNLEKEMLDNEEVVASALTDLDSRLNNKSEIGHNHDDLYVTEAQVDDKIKNIGGNVTSRIGFGKIQINDDTTTIDADLDVDTLTIAQGNGITLTQDITNDKFTISVTDGVFADKEHFHDEYLKSIPSEYVTESEVNELISGKAEADHNHDGVYMTEAQVDDKVKTVQNSLDEVKEDIIDIEEITANALTDLDSRLNTKAEADHNHDGVYMTETQVDDKLKDKTYDDRYYTESEVDALLNGKADVDHNHDDEYVTDAEVDDKLKTVQNSLNELEALVEENEIVTANALTDLDSRLNTKADADHNHDGVYMTEAQVDDKLKDKNYDDRYYTESEVDNLLNDKSDVDHNHDGVYMTEAQVDDKVKTVQNSLDELKQGVIDNELVTANALNDLDGRLNTKADAEHNHDDLYYTQAQVDERFKNIGEDVSSRMAFGKIQVNTNSTTIDADAASDTLIIAQGNGITLTQDTANDKITVSVTENVFADKEHSHDEYLKSIPSEYVTDSELNTKLNNYQPTITDLSDIRNNASTAVSWGNHAEQNYTKTGHEHQSSAITDSITTSNGITSTATGLVEGKAVYEYAQPKGSYQPAGDYAASSHNHKKADITDFAHDHDDRYYTESEIDTLLGGKSNTGHNHNDIYYTESEITDLLKSKSNTGHVHTKSEITDFAHDHDDRYYTESEIDTLLGGKSNTGHGHKKADITDFAHTHSKSEITDFAHNHGTLTLTGDVSGSATINNTNTTVTVTVADDSHNHKASNISDFTSAVDDRINTKLAANDAMLFKGTLGTNGTITSLPATHNAGWTYKVVTAGTYAGQKCEVGDLVMCITDGTAASDSHWTVVQTNTDGHVTGPANATSNEIAIFDGTTGKLIKGSGYETGSFATKGHGHGTLSVSGDVSGSASINSGGTSISLSYNKSATTSQAGVVQLSDSVSSSASTKAATEKAVKTAYDLASSKWTKETATSGATGISKLITGDVSGKTYADGEAAAAAHTHSQYQAKGNYLTSETYKGTVTGVTIVAKDGLSGGGTISASTGSVGGTIEISGPNLTSYVNQNAFSNVVVGSTTISADSATDTLTLAAGTNITLTPDANSDKITINGPDLSGYLKSHQTIYNLTASAGTFSAVTFDPNGSAATINVPTHTSHLTNNSGYITSGTTVKNAQNADKVNNLTVATAVPANAVFTDSKVTSADNHYQANTALTATTTASGGSGTLGFSGQIKVPSITFDKRGHYISATTTTYTLPGNPNTDTNYYLTGVTGSGNGTVTFAVKSYGNVTWNASHDHGNKQYTDTATTESGHYTPSTSASTLGATTGNNYIRGIHLDSKKHVISVSTGTPTNTDTNTWRDIQCNGTSIGTNTLNLKAGTNVSLSNSNGTITISSTDTNTDTKVTSVGNHYTPNSSTTLSASASSATDITNGSGVNVVTGLNIDAAGHVVSVNSAKLKSTDTNTDTNTHYTTRLYAGASGTASNAATSNPYLKVTDDNTYRNQVRFVGGGSTSVSSDASGTITISSTDTNTDTKVTSVGNHYTPSSSTTIGATSGNNYIRGLYVDAAGHVTSVATGTPTNTDTNTWRPITDTWNGTATDTSVSQKGVQAAYTEATEYADGVYDSVINIFSNYAVKYEDILTTTQGAWCGLEVNGTTNKLGLSLYSPNISTINTGRWMNSNAKINTATTVTVPIQSKYYPVSVSYDGYLACYVPWTAGSVDTSGFVLTSGGSKVSGTTCFNKVCISATSATYGTGATLYFGDAEGEVYIRNTADKDLTIYAQGTLNLSGGSVTINGSAISSSDEKVKSETGTSKYYLLGSSSSATTTATTYKHGSVYMSAGTMTCNAYYQGSDERLKDFGDEIEINFDSLKRIPKVYYSWKADDKKEKQIGTSAQKVRDIYPELVGGTDKDMLSVDYARLSVIALKAIDVLHEENEKLRNIIEEMDERIKKLENK